MMKESKTTLSFQVKKPIYRIQSLLSEISTPYACLYITIIYISNEFSIFVIKNNSQINKSCNKKSLHNNLTTVLCKFAHF